MKLSIPHSIGLLTLCFALPAGIAAPGAVGGVTIGPAVETPAGSISLSPTLRIEQPKSMQSVIKSERIYIRWRYRFPGSPTQSTVTTSSSGPRTNIVLTDTQGSTVLTIANGLTGPSYGWQVPANLTPGIYVIHADSQDKTLSAKQHIIIEQYDPPAPPPPTLGSIDCSVNKRTICGVIALQDYLPAAGYRVRAFDSDFGVADINKDDKMGEAITDTHGVYRLGYADKAWDLTEAVRPYTTEWRPDIYIVADRKEPNGEWKKVFDDPQVHNDHKLRDGLRIDAVIPNDGNCPYPDEFSTKGFWHGCKCPAETHKDYTLTYLKGRARCANGPSPEYACNDKGPAYEWVGIDSSHGVCIKLGNFLLHRQAYFAYMKHVRSGVDFKPLPEWFIQTYQPWFTQLTLRDVRIGETSDSSETTSITDCTRIVFHPGVVASLYSNEVTHITHVLHEVAHADQCMGMSANDYGSRRDHYIDKWFKDLDNGTLSALAASSFSVSSAQIHDRMPMESSADDKAAEIVLATGVGTLPSACPNDEFSTRDHRGCQCPSGTHKGYSGAFNLRARCE